MTPMLPGSLQLEWKRCGKVPCRCQRGHLHGPYVSRRWREQGRQRKAYVPREEVAPVMIALAARRRAQEQLRAVQASIKTIRAKETTP